MNQAELDKVKQLPLHASWGVKQINADEGASEMLVEVSESMLNPVGKMHGGILYALTDVSAYAALLSDVEEGQSGVTHQINIQVLRPVDVGDTLIMKSRIIKKGRRLSFLESKGYVGDKMVITATITKSMVLLDH